MKRTSTEISFSDASSTDLSAFFREEEQKLTYNHDGEPWSQVDPILNMCCLGLLQSSAVDSSMRIESSTTVTANERGMDSLSLPFDEEAPILKMSRHVLQSNGSISGKQVADVILPRFTTFASAIPLSLPPQPAIAGIDGRAPLTHRQVHDFVTQEFGPALHALGFGRHDRIALVLPNGSELALAILATAHWASCVPLSANGSITELEADLARFGASLVIGPYSGPMVAANNNNNDNNNKEQQQFRVKDHDRDWSKFRSIEECANKLNIPFCGIVPSNTRTGIFRLQTDRLSKPIRYEDVPRLPKKIRTTGNPNLEPNSKDDEALLLFTSGTTGDKKLVPHLMGDMLVAATVIALSWDLTPLDMNCNLMPLFHVGGIVRQVFSPVFSGGGVICCPSFDPYIFWALLDKDLFNWYYAAPTMHQLIIQTGRENGFIGEKRKQNKLTLKMIANAAGGLLPSLAEEMREVFDANVLPSYGMTECMPISSPPSTYQLEKPGTSGIAVGPEIAILNTATGEHLKPGEEGAICVRGEPCFRGYGKLANGQESDTETFLEGGWFSTGDLGYLDEEGYLYITGRSKEVINRGGEIISPMEVEDAVMGHPDVLACAAFSAPHDVLQEVVGLVLVMKDKRPRLDLPALHEFLKDRLAAPKWPQCLVFMDGLPKSNTNKLLRVKLGERLGIPKLTEKMKPMERTFEAKCPPQGTALTVPIRISSIKISAKIVGNKLRTHCKTSPASQLFVTRDSKHAGALICYLYNIDRNQAIEKALEVLDRYAVPTYFVCLKDPVQKPVDLPPPKMTDGVAFILQGGTAGSDDPVVQKMQKLFAETLNLDYPPGIDANFFLLGGSSMLASQLASQIRKRFSVPINGSEVFQFTSPGELANLIHDRGGALSNKGLNGEILETGEGIEFVQNEKKHAPESVLRREKTEDGIELSTSPPEGLLAHDHLPPKGSLFASLFQFVPMFLVYPIWQVARYILFFSLLLMFLELVPGQRDVGGFFVTYIAFHIIWSTLTPLVFVAIKWTVIGKYRAGRYRIWSLYYLRWWFVDICRKLFMRGVFRSSDSLLNFYYRLLGAKIGKGARISPECDIAEFDLVEIGEEAVVDAGTLRAFGVDNGGMILGAVRVGNRSGLGIKALVAPRTEVPDNAHLGPATSSYDGGPALDEKHRLVNRKSIPDPSPLMQLCAVSPILSLVNMFGQIPPLAVLYLMVQFKGEEGDFDDMFTLIEWLLAPQRIPYYIGIRVARSLLSPLFYMVAAIFVKRAIIGKFKAGPINASCQWELVRHKLASRLLSRTRIQHVTDIIGRHYELVSILYRFLGAKVGRRVFWPGHQPQFTGQFDLLEIGDDVVFGSRCAILLATPDSCEKVILCAGSNVSDNNVVLPGSIIGKKAVLGSNSVCPRGWYLPEESVWFGSKGCEPRCLEKGVEAELAGPAMASEVKEEKLQMAGDESTYSPFAKAFYLRRAPYFVWPLWMIVMYTVIMKAIIAAFHSFPLLGALHGAAVLLYGLPISDRDYTLHGPLLICAAFLCVYFITNAARVIIWLVSEVVAKKMIMGRRQPGRYNYDEVSYGQRWELYQIFSKMRSFSRLNILDFFSGTPFLSFYFKLLGGNIGSNVCLYPSGADPYMPEPDLVTIGPRTVVDCSSLVCHLNTRGNFVLGKIVIENDCTLRARSRLQQGVIMEEGSQILEKSVAMTGEVLESFSVWQGTPATEWFQYPKSDESTIEDSQ